MAHIHKKEYYTEHGDEIKKHEAAKAAFDRLAANGKTLPNHGYDEEKGIGNLGTEDLSKAAEYRGGAYLGEEAEDIYTPVKWKCASGHVFQMSVNAVLHGGHWCPECMRNSWAYPKMARQNPFYAQVWDTQHSPEEDYEIPMEYSAYDIMKELKEKLCL